MHWGKSDLIKFGEKFTNSLLAQSHVWVGLKTDVIWSRTCSWSCQELQELRELYLSLVYCKAIEPKLGPAGSCRMMSWARKYQPIVTVLMLMLSGSAKVHFQGMLLNNTNTRHWGKSDLLKFGKKFTNSLLAQSHVWVGLKTDVICSRTCSWSCQELQELRYASFIM